MEELTLKVKIAVLWIFLAVGMSAAMLVFLMVPGTIEEIIAGKMEGMEISDAVLFGFSIFWLVPLAMAFFSVTLKRASNRVLNIALGLFFAVFYIVDTIVDTSWPYQPGRDVFHPSGGRWSNGYRGGANIPLCTQMAKSNYGEMKQEYVFLEVGREVHLERKGKVNVTYTSF